MARQARDQVTITDINDGAPGADSTVAGPIGPRGAGRWDIAISGALATSYTDAQLNVFLAGVVPGTTQDAPVTGDQIVLTASTGTPRQFVAIYSGTTWTRQEEFIDGSLLVTGTVTADQIAANTITAANIDVDTLVLTSANILTIDGSQVATRSHRTQIDDYIDDLSGVAMSAGSNANGSRVLGGSATSNLIYRFSADVDGTSISPPDNEFRTRRFYYPIATDTSAGDYTVANDRIQYYTIEDITGAQGTIFYTGNNSNDMYRAGLNNNDRTVALEIPSPNMYLNMVEVFTRVDPAIEFSSTGRVNIEVRVIVDGTNIPNLTQIDMEAFAVNIEEFFTVTAGAAPGVDYTFTEDFEVVNNVQLTATTATHAYANVTDSTRTRVVGDGLVYGVARGY